MRVTHLAGVTVSGARAFIYGSSALLSVRSCSQHEVLSSFLKPLRFARVGRLSIYTMCPNARLFGLIAWVSQEKIHQW